MSSDVVENVTKLIEPPVEDIRVTRKRKKKDKRDKPLSKLDAHLNHRKLFHQPVTYNKPWLLTGKKRPAKKQSLYEEKLLPNDTKPILVPKDPTTLGRINFVKDNARKVKKMPHRPVKQRYVDRHLGDTHDLLLSGLQPVFIHRKQKIPKYLREWQRMIEREKKKTEKEKTVCEKLQMSKVKGVPKSKCNSIKPQERQELLLNMKKRWDQLMSEFQTLPFIIATPPQIKRKSTLEKKLNQLEKDIDTIQRHKYIVVYDDSANKENVKGAKSQKKPERIL